MRRGMNPFPGGGAGPLPVGAYPCGCPGAEGPLTQRPSKGRAGVAPSVIPAELG